MHLTRLRLTEYRNHEQTDITLVPGLNLFLGPNGQGKTNVVEAVNFLATGSSHRTHLTYALVKQHAVAAVINADFVSNDRKLNVDLRIEASGGNKARANGNPIRIRDLSRFVHVVLFAPEDLRLIRDDPEVRRHFLDDVIEVLSPRMIAVFSDFERVLKQRNSLLKSLKTTSRTQRDLGTLDLWNDKFLDLSADITVARQSAISALREPLSLAYGDVAGVQHKTNLRLGQKAENASSEDADRSATRLALEAALAQSQDADIERGQTHVGPHRDDVILELNGLPTKGYASHGETWSFALALRLAVAELIRHGELGDPIVILDDVFAELDENRRRRLAEAAKSFEQVLVTAAVASDLPDLGAGQEFRVSEGVVS